MVHHFFLRIAVGRIGRTHVRIDRTYGGNIGRHRVRGRARVDTGPTHPRPDYVARRHSPTYGGGWAMLRGDTGQHTPPGLPVFYSV